MFTCATALLISFNFGLACPRVSPDQLPDKVKLIIENASEIELYSLDPKSSAKSPSKDRGFHGWIVLGKTTLKDTSKKQQILDAIKKGVANGKQGARCFWPRHGIRAKSKGETVDLVICFECSWVYVFYDEKSDRDSILTTDESALELLNATLKEAKVPLPDPPKFKE